MSLVKEHFAPISDSDVAPEHAAWVLEHALYGRRLHYYYHSGFDGYFVTVNNGRHLVFAGELSRAVAYCVKENPF